MAGRAMQGMRIAWNERELREGYELATQVRTSQACGSACLPALPCRRACRAAAAGAYVPACPLRP